MHDEHCRAERVGAVEGTKTREQIWILSSLRAEIEAPVSEHLCAGLAVILVGLARAVHVRSRGARTHTRGRGAAKLESKHPQ